ncbi:hypothetical protein GCM10010331_13100 [Streptomyces xanthochromogenes]|nr:hypothetical protein GCM10010331_13100 [Streptomyces xanthochromogenes]
MLLTGRGASGSRALAGRALSRGRFPPAAPPMIVTLCYGDPDGVGSFVCAQGSVVGVPLR